MSDDDLARFSLHLLITETCWLWTGGTNAQGYGRLSLGRRSVFAHRWSFQHFNRRALDPLTHVCHRCDVPSCVRPGHLFSGTALDNKRDAVAKGRHDRCRRHPGAGRKLRPDGYARCIECEREKWKRRHQKVRSDPSAHAAEKFYRNARRRAPT
jgi:hypothetical protein